MIQEILDEVLDTSLQPDVNPRYVIKDNNGKVINDDVQIEMKTPVVQNPTPLNRATLANLQGDLYTQDRYNKPVIEYGEIDEPALIKRDIMPKNWTKVTDTEYQAIDGSILTVSSILSTGYTPDKMFDEDVSSSWVSYNATESWAKIEFHTPKKITKMNIRVYSLGSAFSSAKILGSNDNETWYELYEISETQTGMKIVTLNNPDFYKYYKIEATFPSAGQFQINEWEVYEYYETTYYICNLNLPLTSYEIGKIVNIEGSNYEEITSFKNLYININNLGAKLINGTIEEGKKCTLIYNGESWDIFQDYVIGSYTGDGNASQFIDLGFTPTAVIVFDNSGRMQTREGDYNCWYGGIAIKGKTTQVNNYKYGILSIENGGFRCYMFENRNTLTRIYTNGGESYNIRNYIAFR